MKVATREYVERMVIGIVKEVCMGMSQDKVVLNASYLDDLGLDSVDTVTIAGELEDIFIHYGFRGFDNNDVGHLNTLRKTVDYIMERVRKA